MRFRFEAHSISRDALIDRFTRVKETQSHRKGDFMLVLTRKRNEVIRIGDDVVVTVLRTGHGSVQLGIEAPSDVNIVRGELLSFGEPSSMVSCSR